LGYNPKKAKIYGVLENIDIDNHPHKLQNMKKSILTMQKVVSFLYLLLNIGIKLI